MEIFALGRGEGENMKSKTAINSIQRIKPSMTALAQILFNVENDLVTFFFFGIHTYLVMSYIVSQYDRQEMIDDPTEHASNAQVG